MNDSWQSGHPYERFMGRWSTLIGRHFLDWLAVPPASRWLDIGCGTGSLTRLVLAEHLPTEIMAIDSSPAFIAHAQKTSAHAHAHFRVGLAQSLPLSSQSMDAVVSGLMLNFVPQPETAVAEMVRVVRPGGTVGIFLWDYAEGMEMLRYFWDAAVLLEPQALAMDEGVRFPLCQEAALVSLVDQVGLKQVETTAIEVTTEFENFEDYWQPFLGEVGPAPSYTRTLGHRQRDQLAETLRTLLPVQENGSIKLRAKAWAVKGKA